MSKPLVLTRALTKRYGSITALHDCSLQVDQGEVFGLLGPNGAGKTTLIRTLLGFLRPSSGTATVDGLDCHRQSLQVRQQVAYLPGDARLFRQMRGYDVLSFFASVRKNGNLDRARKIAERLELDLARRVASMSTGMRQKLALSVTMATRAKLIILDEPTANLDPTVRRTVMQLVREAKAENQTVVFSSHVLSEVEEACDRVVILRSGQLVHTQVMHELRRRHRIFANLTAPLPPPPSEFGKQLQIRELSSHQVMIETPGELSPLLGWLSTLKLSEVRVEPVGLQAVYDYYHPGEMVDQPLASFDPPLAVAEAGGASAD